MNVDALMRGAQAFAVSFVPLLVTSISVLAGLYLVYSALSSLYAKGSDRNSQEAGYGGIGLRLLVGGLLLRFGGTVEDISILITGAGIQDYRGVLAYMPMPQGATNAWMQVIEVCLLWVVMIGWAGAFRGLLLWGKATNGGNSGGSAGDLFWQGIWHLVGGAAAVNMAGMVSSFMGK